jgi:hypothetical protein
MSIFNKLRDRWIETGVSINRGKSAEEVYDFEVKHGVALPRSFKEYLETVDGMSDGQTDEDLISFLSLEMIDQEPNFKVLSGNVVELIFAEYSIYCHYYVLRSSRRGDRSVVVGTNGEMEKHIADSFDNFIKLYLSNPTGIANFWSMP